MLPKVTADWVRLVYVPVLFGRGRAFNLSLKVLLIALLVAGALLEGTLPQLEGKGMLDRALVFWIAAAVVPVAWVVLDRPGGRYPHLIDALFVIPAVGDIVSNFAGMFERYPWWDKFGHFGSWTALCLGFGMLLLCLPIGRANLAGLVIGFGGLTHMLWEIGEWVSQEVLKTAWLHLTHADTMWDLVFGLLGTLGTTFVLLALLHRPVMAERREHGLPIPPLFSAAPKGVIGVAARLPRAGQDGLAEDDDCQSARR
jgi:hypothetical protein